MSFLTDEERLRLMQTAYSVLGTLIQDELSAPAFTYLKGFETEDPGRPTQRFPKDYVIRDGVALFPGVQNYGSKTESQETALDYSQEEIEKMPRLKYGKPRITPDGLFQIRYRREGYCVQFTAKTKKRAEERFREWVKSVNEEKKVELPKKITLFSDFAVRYFEKVKKTNVKSKTYELEFQCLKNHALSTLGSLPIKQITPMRCQELLNVLLNDGKGRTAEKMKVILKEVFRAAVGERLIKENPMEYVKIPKHQKKNGTALSAEEVHELLEKCRSSHYGKQMAIYLYTGIRRNELRSATFDENFVTVADGKVRKGQQQTFRKIPIAPELRKYLPISEKELTINNDNLSKAFKAMLPAHHLYDLRHTFTTFCQVCGIPKALVDVWTGHVNRSDMTTSVYTHFPENFQLQEILKLVF